MAEASTVYDRVVYPSALYRPTHPEHLAAILRLHGLAAADPRRARVLEIAGGDGLNVLAMAAALPDARFTVYDLASAPVARGQALAHAAGMGNVRIEVGDVVELAERLDDRFDYVVAHGLYAWVAPEVQRATLQLIDRVLDPEGVAFISYNAMPGGHLRLALRDMLLFHLAGIVDPAERLRGAEEFLATFGRPRDDDSPSQAALRNAARLTARKNAQTLFHDELGEYYDPKSLTLMCEEAAAHHLSYLTEAQPGGLFHGLPGAGMNDAEVVRRAQQTDFQEVCFFHQSLFIRPGRQPLRAVDLGALGRLLVAASPGLRRTGDLTFVIDDNDFETDSEPLAAFIGDLIGCTPLRLPLDAFVTDEARGVAIIRLANRAILELHSLPFPGRVGEHERPCTTALNRALIAQDRRLVLTLDHRTLRIEEDGPLRFLSLLDGSLTVNELGRRWAEVRGDDEVDARTALANLARAGVLSG